MTSEVIDPPRGLRFGARSDPLKEVVMFAHVASPFLRRVLLIDAAASAAAGLAMAVGANLLEDVLGLPATLLSEAGLILFPFAIYVVAIARRDRISPAAVFAVIACNAVW